MLRVNRRGGRGVGWLVAVALMAGCSVPLLANVSYAADRTDTHIPPSPVTRTSQLTCAPLPPGEFRNHAHIIQRFGCFSYRSVGGSCGRVLVG